MRTIVYNLDDMGDTERLCVEILLANGRTLPFAELTRRATARAGQRVSVGHIVDASSVMTRGDDDTVIIDDEIELQ